MANWPPFQPDFENFTHVLRGGRGWRVPTAELVIDSEVKDQFMGRPIRSLADEIEFRYRAGYDYAWISIGMIDPAGTVNRDFVPSDQARHFAGEDNRAWAEGGTGLIASWDDYERFAFPSPAALDYTPFVAAQALLKPGMKAVAILGKIFTASWMLMGMEAFCEGMYSQPKLIETLVNRIGNIQRQVAQRVVEMPSVGALWMPDDVAYHTGTMVDPAWLRDKVFSHYKTIVAMAHQAGKPVIYHSDGDVRTILDTLSDCGFDALHPIEPESMEIEDVRDRADRLRPAGPRLCLVGNIRVHTLSTGTPDEIRALTRDRIERFGYQGAYVVGSSNSVPNYVPIENYRAMLETIAQHARVPAGQV